MLCAPAGDWPPVRITSRPSVTRCPSRNTASAAETNPPASGVAVTRAGGATRHANGRRSSARNSSGSSAASPTHQPGASDCAGSDTVTTDPDRPESARSPEVARPRAAISPRSRSPRPPPIRIVTGTGSAEAVPAVEPASSITAAPSVTRTAPMPRFGTARPGSSANTRTPRGTAARPVDIAVR